MPNIGINEICNGFQLVMNKQSNGLWLWFSLISLRNQYVKCPWIGDMYTFSMTG